MKFLFLEGENAANFHKRLTKVYNKSALSYSCVTKWVAEFKIVRESLIDQISVLHLVNFEEMTGFT